MARLIVTRSTDPLELIRLATIDASRCSSSSSPRWMRLRMASEAGMKKARTAKAVTAEDRGQDPPPHATLPSSRR